MSDDTTSAPQRPLLCNLRMELYMVRSGDGKWFRRKGYGGFGDSWVDDWTKGRIYGKIGGARAVVSFFAKSYPQYPVPQVIVLHATVSEVLDEGKRIEDRKKRKAEADAKRQVRFAKQEKERARQALEDAQRNYERFLKGG